MIRFAFCALLMLLASSAYADSATQTNWSGGPGVWGPVTSFGSEFYSDSGVEYYSTSGGVSLDLIDQVWAHDVDTSYDGSICARAADVDGDGDLDVVGAAYFADDVTWWENADGLGSMWVEHVVDDDLNEASSVCSEDFDCDGDRDVAATSLDEDGILWWENLDGSGDLWSRHSIDDQFQGARSIRAEDIDGDGIIDLLGASSSLTQIAWWRNLGGAWSNRNIIAGDAVGAQCVCVGDIDGDGTLDVVGNSNGAEISWWDNLDHAGIPGPGTSWEQHLVAVHFMDVYDVHCADVNGDGDLDIIGAANASGIVDDISWWENVDGVGGSWTKHIVDGSFWGAHSVDAADMDEDGDMDILGACWYQAAKDITWWENLDGLGTSWKIHVVAPTVPGASSVQAADLDGDGILDILGSSRTWDFIAWWDVKTYPPEGWLVSSVLDVSCGPDWGALDWTADAPAGTSVAFQVRSSADPDSTAMGPWSDTLFVPCSLHGILPDWEQYIQYRALLMTQDIDITPSLQSVTISWDALGLPGTPDPSGFALLPVRPNPSAGMAGIEFCLPEASPVEIMVFDLSGRLVSSVAASEYSPGYHTVVVEDLPPGIYICRMSAGEFTAARRFVVVE